MLTGGQLRAARAWLRWTVEDLVRESGVSEATINRFEGGGKPPRRPNLQALRFALERAGIEFGADGWIRLASGL